MGGTLTLRLAELFPDAMAGIMLVNPSVMTGVREAKLLPLIKTHQPDVVPDRRRHRQARRRRVRLQPDAGQGDVLAVEGLAVVRADLPKVTVPVLLLHSRVDHTVEPVNSEVVRDGISSTDITDIVLERSYHVATLDYDAELIFTSSVEFIEKVTAGLP